MERLRAPMNRRPGPGWVSRTLPSGAVGAVVYSGFTGGELQQFIPLFLPLLLRVHQTRLRKDDTHTVKRSVKTHKHTNAHVILTQAYV